MKNLGSAELVGATAGGGGYTNDFLALPHGLGASVSIGRSYAPRSGQDWQGVGIAPDVDVPVDHALFTALARLTKESAKLDRLQGVELAIYQTLQSYASAWYGADLAHMRDLIADDFRGTYSDRAGNILDILTKQTLIKQTADGVGVRMNALHYSRIIRDIKAERDQATVTFILRETVHQVVLNRTSAGWLISGDQFKDKIHG